MAPHPCKVHAQCRLCAVCMPGCRSDTDYVVARMAPPWLAAAVPKGATAALGGVRLKAKAGKASATMGTAAATAAAAAASSEADDDELSSPAPGQQRQQQQQEREQQPRQQPQQQQSASPHAGDQTAATQVGEAGAFLAGGAAGACLLLLMHELCMLAVFPVEQFAVVPAASPCRLRPACRPPISQQQQQQQQHSVSWLGRGSSRQRLAQQQAQAQRQRLTQLLCSRRCSGTMWPRA